MSLKVILCLPICPLSLTLVSPPILYISPILCPVFPVLGIFPIRPLPITIRLSQMAATLVIVIVANINNKHKKIRKLVNSWEWLVMDNLNINDFLHIKYQTYCKKPSEKGKSHVSAFVCFAYVCMLVSLCLHIFGWFGCCCFTFVGLFVLQVGWAVGVHTSQKSRSWGSEARFLSTSENRKSALLILLIVKPMDREGGGSCVFARVLVDATAI